jgi:hypothetical protein
VSDGKGLRASVFVTNRRDKGKKMKSPWSLLRGDCSLLLECEHKEARELVPETSGRSTHTATIGKGR